MSKDDRVEIKLKITEDHMDAIEDMFLCDLTNEEHKKIRPLLLDVWEQLCEGMGHGETSGKEN